MQHSNLGNIFCRLVLLLTMTLADGARADEKPAAPGPALNEILSAVVELSAHVPPEARTARSLGLERNGNGVVIDHDGLILTIGYLILEAMSVTVTRPDGQVVLAQVVAYDHDTGFGLVRARQPLDIEPLRLGRSQELEAGDPVLVVGHGGATAVKAARVASRRPFAGYWEYLLERAIFTTPPHLNWGGAALVGAEGQLLGIGSLLVNDARPGQPPLPGNMFVPIDLLRPIFGELLASGRSSAPPRPWLGVITVANEGRIAIARISPEGPAASAGVHPGDVVLAVAGRPVSTLSQLFRTLWGLGRSGVEVPLTLLRGREVLDLVVVSGDRRDYLKTRTSY
jgi:S1-C subfamily serine protease